MSTPSASRQPRRRIIVALDTSSEEQALQWAGHLGGSCGALKVGLELYSAGGPLIVRRLRERGSEIFLDLKLHDIPTTVEKATRALLPLEPLMLNFHALGGREMLRRASEAAREAAAKHDLRLPLLLGVTVLTSHDQASLNELGVDRPLADQVRRLAVIARESGLAGVVASAHEVRLVKEACGDDFVVVTPGIRPAGASVDDQSRTMTPGTALAAGVDYMVIGRPITHAPDPWAALEAIVTSMGQASASDQSQP